MGEPEALKGEMCSFCHTPNLMLREQEMDIPYFGKVFLFSMHCSNCKFHKSDVECAESKGAAKYTLDVTCEDDMKIRVVKSSEGTVKIPRIGSIEPGTASNGYVTNVEGILVRIKDQLERIKEDDDDEEIKDKARAMIKKLNRIMFGTEPVKIIIEDPTGNSAIISDKAVKSKM